MSTRRRDHGHDAEGPSPEPSENVELRASDAERSATVEALRRHAAAGRLDVDELERRLGTAFSARTRGDLAAVLADLPGEAAVRPPAGGRARDLTAYLWVMAVLVGIWLLTGAGHPWPLYPALGWGIPLLVAGRLRSTADGAAPGADPPALRRAAGRSRPAA